MADRVSRRTFIGGAVAGVTAACDVRTTEFGIVPTRMLGNTGVEASVLGLGCGTTWYTAYGSEWRALRALNLAIDLGITYLDTGQAYGGGQSETWLGKVLKDRRKEVFLATKITIRDGDEALRETDRCLERLQTDQIDLLHIHNLAGEDDLERIEAPGGVLEALHRLHDEKVTRFIGITSHTDASVLKTALERHDFDCTQMALNAALQGFADNKWSSIGPSFESLALPAAREKNMGVMAMKITGRGALIGDSPDKAAAPDLLRYALSLPVSVCVIGMSELEYLRENAELVRDFTPMPQPEMEELSGRLSAAHKLALDTHFRDHVDA